MAGLDSKTPVKSLDGTVRPLGGNAPESQAVGSKEMKSELAVRPKLNGSVSSKSLPPPGSFLTGKQEHCKWLRIVRRSSSLGPANVVEISNESLFPNKSPMRYQSFLRRLPCRDLERRLDQSMERLLLSTRTFLFSGIYLYIMFEISLFWIKRGRRSFGRTNCKW